jgi:hypothetical protein
MTPMGKKSPLPGHMQAGSWCAGGEVRVGDGGVVAVVAVGKVSSS